MIFGKDKELEQRLHRIVDQLEEHEKQHTREHWIVIALLAVTITLQVLSYVGT